MNNKDKKQASVTVLPKIIQNKESKYRTGPNSMPTKYQIGMLLGRGGFAQCYRAINIESKKQYAIKVIDKNSESMKKNGARQRLTNQIVLMSRLKHQNIAKLIESFDDEHNYYLVLELCNRISLSQMLRRRTKLSQIQSKYFIRQLISSVLYLKQSRVIHRDIKTPNILLDDNLMVKLGDFGLAIAADSTDPQRNCVCGTPSFMAPQITRKQKYSFEVDMWSVGVVAFILLFGSTPFVVNSARKMSDQRKIDYKYQFPPLYKNKVSEAAKNFIHRIFLIDPKLRLTPQQALCHQFLTQSVPMKLPLECYNRQVSLKQIQQFVNIRTEKIQSIKQTKTREHNTSIHNRTITSYFNKTISDKSILKTAKKDKDNKINKNQILKELKDQQNGTKQIKKPQIQNFEIKIQQATPQNFNKNEKHLQQFILPKSAYQKQEQQQQCSKKQKQKQQILALLNQTSTHQYQQQSNSQLNNQDYTKKQDNLFVDQWLDQKLQQQPFVYQFKDQSQKFGLCYHLSNGIKVVLFNDKTSMAISQINRKVVYLYYTENQFAYCQRLLYKLVRAPKIQQSNKVNQISQSFIQKDKDNKNNEKQIAKPKKFEHIMEFKTHELPKDTNIVKKYFILRDYCRKCTKRKLQVYQKHQDTDLIKCAKMLNKWGCKKRTQQYIFVTNYYIQIVFPEGTNFFINTNKPQFYIANQFENFKKVVELPLRSKKILSKKQKILFQVAQRFLLFIMGKKKQQNQRKVLAQINKN